MTASREKSAAVQVLTVQRWHHAMCQHGQRPVLIDLGVGQMTGRRHIQVEVTGRAYDHDRDYDRWHWMREHDAAVRCYLERLGSFHCSWGGQTRPIGTMSDITPEAAAGDRQ